MKRTNYFYIDEAGNLGNNSDFFIHGCIKTDNPSILKKAIETLRQELLDDLYFEAFVERINSEGFHAVENHPDIRTHFYKILPLLDYRSYFVILDKKSDFYNNLKSEKSEFEIFEYSLRKLLKDRIVKNKNDKNIFYFEQIDIKGKSLNRILNDFFKSMSFADNCEYYIVDKTEENLSVVDYLNYIFIQILNGLKKVKKVNSKYDRMKLNFDLVSSKIGLINVLNNDSFLSRKKAENKKVNYDNFINEFGG